MNSESSEKVNFVADSFQLEIDGEQEFLKGNQSVTVMIGYFKNLELADSRFQNIDIKSIDDSSSLVTYTIESWLNDCFNWNWNHKDTYRVQNNKIQHLKISLGGRNSSQIDVEVEKGFQKWTEKQNLVDSVQRSEEFFRYLKVYCDSTSNFNDDI